MCYIVAFSASTNSIIPYVGNEIRVNTGSNLTFYFGSNGSPNLNGGMPQNLIDAYGDMLTLVVYGAAPSGYAQSFPLFAIFTRNVPIINLSPSIGAIGASVIVSGSNFAASSVINIYFDQQQIATAQSTSGGALPNKVFTVPTAISGVHTITAVDANANSGTLSFTVSAPTLVLNPSIGSLGQQVTASGSNFVPLSLVTISFDGSTIATTTATATGILPTGSSAPKFTIQTTYAGAHTVSANDGVNTITTQFTVNPSIVITPSSGPHRGQTPIIFSGTGFSANSIISVKVDNIIQLTTPATVTTDNLGSFYGIAFTINLNDPNGRTHTVSATDQNGNTAQTLFTGT